MKMKVLMLDAGSILVWKEYNTMRRLWSKLTRKTLPPNRYTIVCDKTELIAHEHNYIDVYEPIRKYSKIETNKLSALLGNELTYDKWEELADIINLVRPKTFNGNQLKEAKYYKKINWNEKLDEYIY